MVGMDQTKIKPAMVSPVLAHVPGDTIAGFM